MGFDTRVAAFAGRIDPDELKLSEYDGDDPSARVRWLEAQARYIRNVEGLTEL